MLHATGAFTALWMAGAAWFLWGMRFDCTQYRSGTADTVFWATSSMSAQPVSDPHGV